MAIGALRQDVTFAIRLLRKSPAFSLTAAATIALAVGVNTAVFSVVNASMMRPLPVRDGERLAVLATSHGASTRLAGVSFPDLEDYRAATRDIFQDIAGYSVGFVGLRPEGGRVDRVLVTWVTGNYFTVLGVQPHVGRLIREDDVGPGRPGAVVVLGYAAWQRRFEGDPSIVGKTALVNGARLTIAGVVPQSFTGTQAFSESEIYLPVTWGTAVALEDRGSRSLHAFGRLQPGVRLAIAEAAINVVAQRLAREHPETNHSVAVTVIAEPFARPIEDAARSNTTAAAIMLALVALVAIVGAVNVTNLLLARGLDRRRELAVRAALGAARFRLVRQMTVESLVLVALGGSAGLVAASWTAAALARVQIPGDLPVRLDFALDGRVLAYAAAVGVLLAIVVGLVPALSATRMDLVHVLREVKGGNRLGRRHGLTSVLVVAEIGAALTLLVATGLFVRSLHRAERADFGFDPDHVLNLHMDVGQLGYSALRGTAFFDAVERRVLAMPGVQSTSYAFTAPIGYIQLGQALEADGTARVSAGFNIVTPEYFRTLGVAMIGGRPFTNDDDERSAFVAIVNRRLAEQLWPGQDPVGRRVRIAGADSTWLQVVGVTATGKYRSLFEDPTPYFYLPASQHYTGLRVLHVRTSLPPESLARTVEQVVHDLEPDLPVYDVQSMRSALGGGYGLLLVRLAALGASLFGVLGLALALVGVYGVMAYASAQRTYEVGVRMALGAAPFDIVRLLLRDGTVLVIAGSSTGLAAALAVSHAMRNLLFGISPLDVWAFGVAAPLVGCAALIGCGIPAWRAARADPMAALRLE